MLYPSNIEEKLGFDKIKSAIAEKCQGELGQSYVDEIRFSTDHDQVIKLLKQTAELLSIMQSGTSFPRGEYYNLSKLLVKASKIDAHLTEEEFHEMKLTLRKAEDLLKFFKKDPEQNIHLSLLTVGVYLNPQILYSIDQVIDERGTMRNTASDELLRIRDALQELEFRIRRKLERILKKFVKEGYSSEEMNITIRNGRLVVPVRAEFKRVVGGFIHDESASGQTAFIEPSPLVEMNNDIRDLYHKERREIHRILTTLTDLIRPEIDNLRKCYEFVGVIDFIQAKATYAIEMDAVMPQVVKSSVIDWTDARHPLLFIAHKRSGKAIVPLNIHLSPEQRILVISGPNAGGKSVCLQTVGLIQYMTQCGLLVPLEEKSKTGVFQRLFIDIGDEQSLENDLSTYSSHLMNMQFFLSHATKKTLFLIDEFGTGTEPQFGGAIAEAILDKLRWEKAYGVITTHYTNLKKYAERTPGVVNGAMRFDIARMEPLFDLQIGIPGSSFALEIASKIGLPPEVIQEAKKGIGASHVNFERLLGELEQEKGELGQQKEQLRKKELELEVLLKKYHELKEYLEGHRESMVREARTEAESIINQANKEIEKTIRLIKEAEADKERTKMLRKNLEKFRQDIAIKKPKPLKKTSKDQSQKFTPMAGEITTGDYVRIRNQETVGQVIELKGNQAEVAIGDLKSKLKLSRLEKISKNEFLATSGQPRAIRNTLISSDLSEKMKRFNTTLDLRGKRAEEAVSLLNTYMDEALLLGANKLRILHGKGDGILRDVVRTHLRRSELVEDIRDEEVERGGSGVTVLLLK